MSFKKRFSKSIALVLIGVTVATPMFNSVHAMEISNNEISYEEVIKNIDYEEIENSSEQQSRFASLILKLFSKIHKKLRLSKELHVNLTKFNSKNGKKLIE